MVSFDDIKFKKLDFNGLQTLVNWAENEGWNPGPHDAEVYWATDPDGYYGYFIDERLIGGGSVVSYDDEFGFMGFFIVDPEFRSIGLGKKLWYQRRDLLISRLEPGATIGMDGVLAMQEFYTKGGFNIAYRDERHEKIGYKTEYSNNINLVDDNDLNDIVTYDSSYFGVRRPQFLIPWLKMPLTKSFVYRKNGKLLGYTNLRKANKGYKICPLFAEYETIAEELYKACLNSAIDQPVYLDIPVINNSAVNLIKKYNTTYIFECARMYYGNPPSININNIYGITTFELG